MGRAISKAVTIAEILKRKIPLHQVTLLTSSEIIDVSVNIFGDMLFLTLTITSVCSVLFCFFLFSFSLAEKIYEPLEEGLDVVESTRYVSCMTITLSVTSDGLDVTDIGYQPPLPLEEIQQGDLNVRHGNEMGSSATRVV